MACVALLWSALTLTGCLDAQTASSLVDGVIDSPTAPTIPTPTPGTITVRGTGGTESIQIELTGDATFSIASGQFVIPTDASFQRMMVWETVDLSSPGTYTLAATCMQRGNTTPEWDTLFDPGVHDPSTSIERCQSGCGGDQECVWSCQ